MVNSKLKQMVFVLVAGACLFSLTGCVVTTSATIGYDRYYDPHPRWGHGDDRTIIIDRPDKKPERPSKPPKKGRPKS